MSDSAPRTPLRRPRLYAHRGASVDFPENTLLAFRAALEQGADALETDLHLTRDGAIVVAHDADGRRMAGVARAIRESKLAEIRRWNVGYGFRASDGSTPYRDAPQRVPTLEELLDAFPGVVINVDLKTPTLRLSERFRAIIEQRSDGERVQVGSFHHRLIWALRRSGYAGVTALTAAEVLLLLGRPELLKRALRGAAVRAQIPQMLGPVLLASPRLLRNARACGIPVDVFTINDPERARMFARQGVDGVMSDEPALIAGALGEQ